MKTARTSGPGAGVLHLLASLTSMVSIAAGAAGQCESQKLLMFDGDPSDRFGSSLAATAGRIVVGAELDDENGIFFTGSASVFSCDEIGCLWQTKLVASDGATSDAFGISVAIDGDVVIVGASAHDDLGHNSGAAYIYRFDGSSWNETKLLASDGAINDHFGRSVAISGDVALVGAFADDDNGNNSGSAYWYQYDGAAWVEMGKLLASDGTAEDRFGRSVAMSGNVAVIGAGEDDDIAQFGGSAYIFRFDPSTSTWTEEAKLLASDGMSLDWYGQSVAIDGDCAIVGAPQFFSGRSGRAYIYHFDGSSWVEQARLSAGDGELQDHFGYRVDIAGGLAIAGVRFDDDLGEDSGSAYVFRFEPASSRWLKLGKLTASDGAAMDRFGESVALLGETAFVGAVFDDDNGIDSGSVYVFDLSSGPSDLNCDGAVDVMDLLILLSSWGTCAGASPCSQADLNGDGAVNVLDLLGLLADWG